MTLFIAINSSTLANFFGSLRKTNLKSSTPTFPCLFDTLAAFIHYNPNNNNIIIIFSLGYFKYNVYVGLLLTISLM